MARRKADDPTAALRWLADHGVPGLPCRLVVGARAYPEQWYFELWPARPAPATHPLVAGVSSAGRPGQGIVGWLDLDYCDRVRLADGTTLDLAGALGRRLFRALGRLVPPNGRLMVAYELFARPGLLHRQTQLELERGAPPLATPLGGLLYVAGCWLNIRDWYIPEGGREGPRKLQGNRPLDTAHLRRRAGEALADLSAFLTEQRNRPTPELAAAEQRARRLLAALRRRFANPAPGAAEGH